MASKKSARWWLVTATIDGVKYVRTRNSRWTTNAGCSSRIRLYASLATIDKAMLRANVENWEAVAVYQGTKFDCCGNVFREEEVRPADRYDKVICRNGKVYTGT